MDITPNPSPARRGECGFHLLRHEVSAQAEAPTVQVAAFSGAALFETLDAGEQAQARVQQA
jgi:hypothetical protein